MADDGGLLAHCQSRVGAVLSGKWRLDALIGVGGMAAVYAATHRNNSMAAIKILHPEVAQNKDIRERFLREAYIANKVGHSGTVKVLDDDVDDIGSPYLVMELLQGNSVEAWAVSNGGTLSIAQTLDIADQTLSILEAAHAEGIVHRDLKPENLFLVDNHSVVKMLDFGIARLRQDSTKKTQTGMVMGTPAFMAPEQALGRWKEVDARTDLWAVGATIFTLLTGRSVHEAETPGEMLVKAASHEARSLARAMPEAPVDLVRIVDRALAYRPEQRFPDAAAFRAEILVLKEQLGETANLTRKLGAKPSSHETAVDLEAQAEDDVPQEEPKPIEVFDPKLMTSEDKAAMRKVFDALENALIATKQYGPQHPECKRRQHEIFKEAMKALAQCSTTLAWNVSPYAFHIEDTYLWEPQPPLNRVPYQLFSDGVRTLGFSKDLDEAELAQWIRLITLDPATDMAPEDDLVTLLWDANLQHAYHEAIDTFAEGDQRERELFEAEKQQVLAAARHHGVVDIADAWKHRERGRTEDAQQKSSEIVQYLTDDDTLTKEAIAQAQNMDARSRNARNTLAARALAVDESTRALLAARLNVDVGATSERFVVATAHAFRSAAEREQLRTVSDPVRITVEGLAKRAPHKAIEMVLALREAAGETWESVGFEEVVTNQIVSVDAMRSILAGAPTPSLEGTDQDEFNAYLRSLGQLLDSASDQLIDIIIEAIASTEIEALRTLLMKVVQTRGAGHEATIASLFSSLKVSLELGLELVRLLAAMATPEAKAAIVEATRSPHPLVRIEALGHSEGVSSDRLRIELRKLLEDDDPSVRLAALAAMENYNISVAGPFVVLRIQDKAFMKLPFEERKQALQTVCTLRPKRAEELCVELLSRTALIRSRSLEETRILAAQILGDIAVTKPAFYLLDEVSRSNVLKAGEEVREAAKQALARIAERSERAKAAAARKATMTTGTPTKAQAAKPARKAGSDA